MEQVHVSKGSDSATSPLHCSCMSAQKSFTTALQSCERTEELHLVLVPRLLPSDAGQFEKGDRLENLEFCAGWQSKQLCDRAPQPSVVENLVQSVVVSVKVSAKAAQARHTHQRETCQQTDTCGTVDRTDRHVWHGGSQDKSISR
jgi:hypothetical protein